MFYLTFCRRSPHSKTALRIGSAIVAALMGAIDPAAALAGNTRGLGRGDRLDRGDRPEQVVGNATQARKLHRTLMILKANRASLRQKSVSSAIESLNGTWEGSYTCRQGLTRLRLVISAKSTTDIDAVFIFSAHPHNPGVPSGRFRMEGTLEVFNSPQIPDLLELKATTWIDRPPNYGTVDLRGDISGSGRRITGQITTPGCSSFEVIKSEQGSSLVNYSLPQGFHSTDFPREWGHGFPE